MFLSKRLVISALLLGACWRGRTDIGRELTTRLTTSPPRGPVCYRGVAQLLRDTIALPPHAHERRWLILDPRQAPEPPGYQVAYLVTPEGRDWPVHAVWRRAGDSLEIREIGGAYPPASWVFVDSGPMLVGRGEMVHDVGTKDSAGRFVPARSRWRARAERIACTDVP